MGMSESARVLIVMALPEENAGGRLDGFGEVLYTGVGKVNAAMMLTRRLSRGPLPHVVINLGSAGAQQRATGSVVACTAFVEHDMNATALGFAHGQTPFEADVMLSCPLPVSWQTIGLNEAVCYTGDLFVCEPHTHFEYDVVDMEGYALARVCQLFCLPLVSLKFITDGADGQAALDWNDAVIQAAAALAKVMQQIQATQEAG
jgi:adenosylhomocysteine nucleosidase